MVNIHLFSKTIRTEVEVLEPPEPRNPVRQWLCVPKTRYKPKSAERQDLESDTGDRSNDPSFPVPQGNAALAAPVARTAGRNQPVPEKMKPGNADSLRGYSVESIANDDRGSARSTVVLMGFHIRPQKLIDPALVARALRAEPGQIVLDRVPHPLLNPALLRGNVLFATPVPAIMTLW